jgi:hypothetical protein
MVSMEDMPNEILYNVASYVIDSEHKRDIFSLKSTNKTLEVVSCDLIAQKRPYITTKMVFMESYLGMMKYLYNGIVDIFSRYGIPKNKYYIYYKSRTSNLRIRSTGHSSFILDRIYKISIFKDECILYGLLSNGRKYDVESDRISYYGSKFVSITLKSIKKLFYKLPKFVHKNFKYLKMYKILQYDVEAYINLANYAPIDIIMA